MHTVTKTFEWSMAHRLVHDYTGKCKNIHGHTYKAEITIEGPIDPKNYGMVVDFGDISKYMKEWVMENLDHAMIVDYTDQVMIDFLKAFKQKHFVMPNHFINSTAENLCCLLADVFQEPMKYINETLQDTEFPNPNQVVLLQVTVWETPTSCSTWRRPK